MIVRAPGKMILLGEYAVLEGAPALVTAVDRWADVRLTPREGGEFVVQSPSLGIQEEPFVVTPKNHLRFNPLMDELPRKRLSFFGKIFEAVLVHLAEREKTVPPLTVRLTTDDFYSQAFHAKLGFGSSAAMTVALVYALLKFMDRSTGLAEIYALANRAHHEAQGKIGSGVDIAASVFGGRLVFKMAESSAPGPQIPKRVAAWKELKMLTVWTGKTASTRRYVQGVHQLRDTNPVLYKQLMARLKTLSEEGCAAYENQNLEDFLQTIGAYYSAMQALGNSSGLAIISEDHEKLASEAGALGLRYKPSGAGGGDIGLAFGRDEGAMAAFSRRIGELGFHLLDINATTEGVHILDEK